MSKIGAIVLFALSLGITVAVNAQNLDMSRTSQAATFDAAGKPTRGMSQSSVEASYGSPQSTRRAIGEPPITRWEYPGFVVYFEFDKVIHSVSKR